MTNNTAAPIPKAVLIFLLTPKNGQIPKNWLNTILFTNIAEINIRKYTIILIYNLTIYHLLLQEFLYQCHQVAQYDERTRSEHENQHTIGLAVEVHAEQATCTEQLTHCTNQSQCQ